MSPPRTHRLLEAPVLPTLARLSAPGALLVVFQAAVSITDTHFIGRLGTGPLAGLALVFPLVMLLQMTSAGAMGGGVSSAVARAQGAGNEPQARALVVHAVVIALGMGLAFSALLLVLGRPVYRLLGGEGEVLGHALAYSNVLFSGAVLVWLANTFASVLRGTGNTLVPALALAGAAFVHVPLSATLVLGLGPFPQLGIAGAGVAYLVSFSCAALATGSYIWRSPLRPQRVELRLQAQLFREILRVGAISSVSAVLTVLTAVVLTGLVGRFGAAALAGYGVGVRLEMLQIPLVFAIGQALVALVGVNIGAGRAARAKQIAWTGAALAACVAGVIGLAAALVPHAWVLLFSSDPAVLSTGSLYLRIVGPFYPVMGFGIALYFASQGVGRVMVPMAAGAARLAVVLAAGLALGAAGAPLGALFAVIALGMLVYGALIGWSIFKADWSR